MFNMFDRCSVYRKRRKAFMLMELLVVIVILALLIGILLPALRKIRRQGQLVVCATNLHNIGMGIHAYSIDHDNTIPFGPEGRPVTATNFYTSKGNVTSLISLEDDGAPVGLGLMLSSYLQQQPKVLFCPGADQHSDADEQLALVGNDQAQCDYYYRHGSVAQISGISDTFHVDLSDLGKNRNDRLISALVMDVQFLIEPAFSTLGIIPRTSHKRQAVNILLADNRVIRQDNSEDTYTVDVGWFPHTALDMILVAFEKADELR